MIGLLIGWVVVAILLGCVERIAGYEARTCGIPWGLWEIVAGFLTLNLRNEVLILNPSLADLFLYVAIAVWVLSAYSLLFRRGKRIES